MLPTVDDTIVAIASPTGGAPRGILRVTGPQAVECVARCFQGDAATDWQRLPRATRVTGALDLSAPIGLVPCDLYLWPGLRSYTRQPTVELHLIGSPPVLDAALRVVSGCGARLARPGEFTLRAFLAGRLDLAQAEAVLGVIDARGQRELDLALTQLAGGMSRPLHALRERLLNLCADLEAGLDFVEEDIAFISVKEVERQLTDAAALVEHTLDRMTTRGESTTAPRIVLRGWPNVGKSSLWNALVGDGRAIVAIHPGTTRDYLTAHVNLDGMLCVLVDTAGVLPAGDELGQAAQRIAIGQQANADVVVLCFDASRTLNEWERRELESTAPQDRLLVLTKADLSCQTDLDGAAIATSSRSGQGIPQLRTALRGLLESRSDCEAGVVASTGARCYESLGRCLESLMRGRDLTISQAGDELVVLELRCALDELGQVVGAVYTDELLDRIFSRFCIGK